MSAHLVAVGEVTGIGWGTGRTRLRFSGELEERRDKSGTIDHHRAGLLYSMF